MRSLYIGFVIWLAVCSGAFGGCMREKPTQADGTSHLVLLVLSDTSSAKDSTAYAPVAGAEVILSSEYGMKIGYTDEFGRAQWMSLPSSEYSVTARAPYPGDPTIQLVGSLEKIEVPPASSVVETVMVEPTSSTGLVINEIYSSGPVNNFFFFFDQFIELYNASGETKYLDGMMVMRVSGNNDGKGPGADEGNDGDIDGVTYAFKFPGTPGEHNYPIRPRQFVVLASDAVDHRKTCPTSIDLSHADWEFYNQYSAEDIDNPNVPNVINMRSDRTTDFLINLVGDIVVLSSGEDSVWSDGIDIRTIIDAVEYHGSPTVRKTLDPRVDRGFTLSPPRYSGMSMQRREPGYDTNNSTLDFEIISHPTPGYQ